MPNRLIRDGINRSERVNKLSPGAEVFFRRVLNEVDDFGRFSAHPSLLLAACFPLKLGAVTTDDIESWLEECINVVAGRKSGLIVRYEINGEFFIQVLNFKNKPRAKKSKYPPPPSSICVEYAPHMYDTCTAHAPETEYETDTDNETEYEDGEADGSILFRKLECLRDGRRVPADKYGVNVRLTEAEYAQMVADWGETFAREAIGEYDDKFPNSAAIRRHTDHNRGIRDYVKRGYLCGGKAPAPPAPKKRPPVPSREEMGSPEERVNILKSSWPIRPRESKPPELK